MNILRLKIALRLYHNDHGELPVTLDALVPDYISEIPLDPFDDKPLKYRLEPEPVIYSVGFDFIDDGGEGEYQTFETSTKNVPMEGDLVFPVFAGGE